ncbi:MAG: hypothetical protein ABW003_06780, partial [Microvirga sp.]
CSSLSFGKDLLEPQIMLHMRRSVSQMSNSLRSLVERRWSELDIFRAVPAYRMRTFAVQEGSFNDA